VVAEVSKASPDLQHRMLEATSRAAFRLCELGDSAWLALLRDAGRRFVEGELPLGEERLDLSKHARCVAETSGIPTLQVVKASLALAEALDGMEAILRAQGLPAGSPSASGVRPALAPAGRHMAVRVPDAHPAVHRTWLAALAMRRPVLLCAAGDPLTPARLVEALYAAGLPDGAVSLCFGEADLIFARADQVLWSGAAPAWLGERRERLRRDHHGGCKAVLLERACEQRSADLAASALAGSGRLCTKLSALLVAGDADEAGSALAEALARSTVAPLDDAEAIVPAFPDRALAERIDAIIAAAEARGAVDLSAHITGGPRLVELDGALFLRPTVLLVDCDDPLLGAELPFPFVTVAAVPRAELPRACRGSLAVALIGEDQRLDRALRLDPSIDRVLHGARISAGERADDPHEGLLAGFLFRMPAAAITPSPPRSASGLPGTSRSA
jgi:thienamycin biosynthesis protein ThnO